jgi:hypothetical protein
MIYPLQLRGLREGLDRVLRDVLTVQPGEQVAAVLVVALVVAGSGPKRRSRWTVQCVQAAQLRATRPELLGDAAHALRQVATSEADA